MRKIIKVIISLICCGVTACVIAVSCGVSYISEKLNLKEPKEYDPTKIWSDDFPFAEKTMLAVLKCFDERDKETLKSMFSEEAQLSYNLDEEIDIAMDFYEGKSVSHDKVQNEIGNSRSKKDENNMPMGYAYKSIITQIRNIITDNNKNYMIEMIYTLVDEEDEKSIGISSIIISDPVHVYESYSAVGFCQMKEKNKRLSE